MQESAGPGRRGGHPRASGRCARQQFGNHTGRCKPHRFHGRRGRVCPIDRRSPMERTQLALDRMPVGLAKGIAPEDTGGKVLERIDDETEKIETYLTKGKGLGGRTRTFSHTRKKAVNSVGQAVRRALKQARR